MEASGHLWDISGTAVEVSGGVWGHQEASGGSWEVSIGCLVWLAWLAWLAGAGQGRSGLKMLIFDIYIYIYIVTVFELATDHLV